MDQDDTDAGTGDRDYDEVFFVGGTGPFANSDEDDDEEEQLIIDGNEDLLDDSDNDPDGVQKNSKQKPVVGKRKNTDLKKLDLGQSYKTVHTSVISELLMHRLKSLLQWAAAMLTTWRLHWSRRMQCEALNRQGLETLIY
jgi:hypothetical protein